MQANTSAYHVPSQPLYGALSQAQFHADIVNLNKTTLSDLTAKEEYPHRIK